MCDECWESAGSPAMWSDAVEATVNLICDLYDQPDGTVGGPLHVYVDDWNLDVANIEPYYGKHIRWAPETVNISERLARLLTALTYESRYSALGHAEGYACTSACSHRRAEGRSTPLDGWPGADR